MTEAFWFTPTIDFATALLLGVALIGVVYYFFKRARRLAGAMADLYALNQQVNQDALDFFRRSWPILKESGCLQIKADVFWFGEKKRRVFGTYPEKQFQLYSKKIEIDDMSFDIEMVLTREAAQKNSLANLVIKTFLNVLEQDMVLKRDEILSSQKRLERYQMFVQHEVKNIAQFVNLLSEQVQRIDKDADKIRLVDRLGKSLPVMAERARNTIQTMRGQAEIEVENTVESSDVLTEVVRMFDLNAKILGHGKVRLSRSFLIEVLKNVLGNFRDHNTESKITIYISDSKQPDKIEVQIFSEIIPGVSLNSERLFEPFWTTSESGLGLGLFLARELLKQHKGEIRFQQTTAHFGFILSLPKAV